VTVGRRRVILIASFICLIVALPTKQGYAQPQPPKGKGFPNRPQLIEQSEHEIWGKSLTPEQLKEALSRFGQTLGNPNLSTFDEMLKEYLANTSPKVDPNDPELQQTIKKLRDNKEFMDMARRMAKEKTGKPGETPKFSPEDIAKLLENMPKEKLPPDLKLPEGLPGRTQKPNDLPTNDPNRPDTPIKPIDPKKLSKSQGPSLNKSDPNDPQNQKPVEGKQPFPDPRNPGQLFDQGKQNPFAPDNNPFGRPDEPTDPRAKSMEALASLWERNIGPLDQTPEVKRAIFDLVSGENGFDFDLKDEHGNSFWDALKNEKGDGSSFSDFFKDGGGENWKWPDGDMPTIGWDKWFGNSSSSPGWHSSSPSSIPHMPESSPSSSSGWGFGGSGGGADLSGSWFSVVLLALVVLGALLLWWYLRDAKDPVSGKPASGPGAWPIDPHAINSREDVVKAFEYLSVLICGPAAKMWTHGTIAAALTDLAVTHGEIAVKLARLYELARYAPLDEPLTRAEIIEARQIVCDLAEVS
jgi:hypothetical protein